MRESASGSEDNKLKKEQIIKLIDKEFLCLLSIDVAYNLEEAKNKIMNSKYDIYILDLSIKSGLHEASIDYGFEIYDTIKNLTKNIIIYSTVDNLIKHPRNNEFNENLVPFIDYTSKEKDWEYKLIEFLRNFVKFDELNYDIAILTALDDEFHWMKKASETSWYSFEKNDNTFYVSKISNDFGEEVSIVAYSINKMGIAYSSSIATKILIDFKPKLLVMTGICAGLEKVADKGDIIVPEYIFNYQEGDITEDGFVPAFKVKQLNSKISKLVKQTKDSYTIDIKNDWEKKYNSFGKMPGGTFKIINEKHFGTGSAVVKDETILNDIKKYNQKDIVGLDMEGYSIFIACEVMEEIGCKPLLIKAVQDYATKAKDKDFRCFSSFASASYFFRLCKNRLITKLKNDW